MCGGGVFKETDFPQRGSVVTFIEINVLNSLFNFMFIASFM